MNVVVVVLIWVVSVVDYCYYGDVDVIALSCCWKLLGWVVDVVELSCCCVGLCFGCC